MQITYIDNIQQFDQLKIEWDRVYAADSHANIEVSWPWLRGWFEVMKGKKWVVLAFRPTHKSSYAAFLPLNIEGRTIALGGNNLACHTGVVSLPEHNEEAIAAFATYIQSQMRWDEFQLGNVLDPRLDLFLTHFSPGRFAVQELNRTACPYVLLPDSWDEYLQEHTGKSIRNNLKYYTKKIEGLYNFRMTEVGEDNLEEQMDVFLKLWQMRWGNKPYEEFQWFRATSRYCLKNECLWLNIIWDGANPIAGMKAYIDRDRSTFSYVMLGWNSQYAKLSPGNIMVGYSIRYAIEHGYKIFDFLLGAEPYKYLFGAKDRFDRSMLITRKEVGTLARRMLRKSGVLMHAVKRRIMVS